MAKLMHKDENYTGGGDTSDLMRYTDNAILGAKNLLQNTATSQTEHGVTFTVNSDGSVNVSGTASGGNGFITLGTIELKQGVQYILSGGVSGNLRIDLRNSDYSMWTNNTASQEVHSPKESFIDTFTPNNTEVVYVCARAQSGSTVSGTLYPMLRLATDTDDTYVPYAKTNRELTDTLSEKFVSKYMQNADQNLTLSQWDTISLSQTADNTNSDVFDTPRNGITIKEKGIYLILLTMHGFCSADTEITSALNAGSAGYLTNDYKYTESQQFKYQQMLIARVTSTPINVLLQVYLHAGAGGFYGDTNSPSTRRLTIVKIA